MRHVNIPIFIAHYGCPHMCVFCNQTKITGCETNIKKGDISKIIDEHLRTIRGSENKIEVAFFGGTFTAIKKELQKEYLDEVKDYIDSGKISGVRISTRPDNIDEETVKFLKENNVVAIELGAQSFNNEVLSISERGNLAEDIVRASKIIKSYDIELGLQLMLGLPGSDFIKEIENMNQALLIKPDTIRIYPTLVISGTKLEEMHRNGEYTALGLEDAQKIAAIMIANFEYNNIKIIRVGLQPSDEIRSEGTIIAGPFHPAFRELAESEIYFIFLKKLLKEKIKSVVYINERDVSRVRGIKSINIEKLENSVEVSQDNSILRGSIVINNKTYTRKDILESIINDFGKVIL